MAGSAYASLRSLITVIERVQSNTCPVVFDESQMGSLLEKVTFLVEILEGFPQQIRRICPAALEDLYTRIVRVAQAAEDSIEYYVVNTVLLIQRSRLPDFDSDLEDDDFDLIFSYPDVNKSIQDMNVSIQQAMDVKKDLEAAMDVVPEVKKGRKKQKLNHHHRRHHLQNERGGVVEDSHSRTSQPQSSFLPIMSDFDDDNIFVGFGEQLNCLMNMIKKHERSREIIRVVGMGGIGKSTLARNYYNLPSTATHFDTRAWVTISQEYTIRKILFSLLEGSGIDVDVNVDDDDYDIDKVNDNELGECLRKGLWGRRYLIILDDVWSVDVWDEIKWFFPNGGNGSKILFTTRNLNVANDNPGSCNTYNMKLLDQDASWKLLSTAVFGKDAVAAGSELEQLGKKIAECCKGLPLTLVVIGGILKSLERTTEIWESIAENVKSIIHNHHDGCYSDIISLSYNHLPIHLKPCFLYMATYEEDSEIKISDMIKLWVADGFLKPMERLTLEEAALKYLNDLIHRNLVMVKDRRGVSGEVERCTVHDLIREFCLKEVRKERFICHLQKSTQYDQNDRRFVYPLQDQNDGFVYPWHSREVERPDLPLARSFICTNHQTYSELKLDRSKLLRVLCFPYINDHVMNFINIRYLRCRIRDEIEFFTNIFLFRYLETLIVHSDESNFLKHGIIVPSEIWELQYLRHVESTNSEGALIFPDPKGEQGILKDLQTLWGIDNFNCNGEVIKRVPNLKRLKAVYRDDEQMSGCFTNLAHLHQFETLECVFKHPLEMDIACVDREMDMTRVHMELENLTLLCNLRELRLDYSRLPWEKMRIIGSLPSLQVLGLDHDAFCGDKWEMNPGEFQCLKYLEIYESSLRIWEIDGSAFPKLEDLVLNEVYLDETPFCLVELPCIESITWMTWRLYDVLSAYKILKHAQEDYGNHDLLIKVHYLSGFIKVAAVVKELASDNFQVKTEFVCSSLYEDKKLMEEIMGTETFNKLKLKEYSRDWLDSRGEVDIEVSNWLRKKINAI